MSIEDGDLKQRNFLSWEGVNFHVDTPTQGKLHILKDSCGYAVGGRLLAIMGASGSGYELENDGC